MRIRSHISFYAGEVTGICKQEQSYCPFLGNDLSSIARKITLGKSMTKIFEQLDKDVMLCTVKNLRIFKEAQLKIMKIDHTKTIASLVNN